MAECVNCKIEVLDETELCPLCRSILRPTEAVENMYPDVRVKMHKCKLIANIYLFCALCAQAALVTLNILLRWKIWWKNVKKVLWILRWWKKTTVRSMVRCGNGSKK